MCYQTHTVWIPFLGTDIETVIRKLMKRFIKPLVLSNCTTDIKLIQVDVNQITLNNIDIDIEANQMTKQLIAIEKDSDLVFLHLRKGCRDFLIRLVDHMLINAPMKYCLVRNVTCLTPTILYMIRKDQ